MLLFKESTTIQTTSNFKMLKPSLSHLHFKVCCNKSILLKTQVKLIQTKICWNKYYFKLQTCSLGTIQSHFCSFSRFTFLQLYRIESSLNQPGSRAVSFLHSYSLGCSRFWFCLQRGSCEVLGFSLRNQFTCFS